MYPISLKMTDLLSIDDLKVFAASQIKLRRVLRSVKDDVECVGLKWNKKKCAVAQTGCEQRGLIQGAEDLKIDNAKAISSLEEGGSYKFLGALENVKQEDRIVLQNAAKVYLQRLSIIWSSPLLDYHIVAASNQYACTNRCYQPNYIYHQRKTGKGTSNAMCRMYSKSPESVPHVLVGCGTLAQTKYLA